MTGDVQTIVQQFIADHTRPDQGSFEGIAIAREAQRVAALAAHLRRHPWQPFRVYLPRTRRGTPQNSREVHRLTHSALCWLRAREFAVCAWDASGQAYYALAERAIPEGLTTSAEGE